MNNMRRLTGSLKAVSSVSHRVQPGVVLRPAPVTFSYRHFSSSEAPKTEEAVETEAKPEAGEAAKPVDPTIALNAEIKDLKEKVLRSLAEEENVRRIAKRDVDNAHSYANTSFAKAMLEVADDLERALSTVPAEKRTSADPTLSTLVQGIEMTDKNLLKIFAKFGVVKYGKVDEKFDPNLHDALYQIPDAEKPNTIGMVVKSGYKLKDRVIRAAQVGARVEPPK
jgi:molecular chaperone GrpE